MRLGVHSSSSAGSVILISVTSLIPSINMLSISAITLMAMKFTMTSKISLYPLSINMLMISVLIAIKNCISAIKNAGSRSSITNSVNK